MSSPYDAIFANDLDYMNGDAFSDQSPVILTAADNSQVQFSAIIERKPPTFVAGMANDPKATRWPTFEVWISSNVLARKPDKNGDKLTFASHAGATPSDHVITAILAEDAGGWLVECR